jgi:hypothetical protein
MLNLPHVVVSSVMLAVAYGYRPDPSIASIPAPRTAIS